MPIEELIGIALGHILWFLSDEWPRRPESNGINVLSAPFFVQALFRNPDLHTEIDAGENFNNLVNYQAAQNVPNVNIMDNSTNANAPQENISQNILKRRVIPQTLEEKSLNSTSSADVSSSNTQSQLDSKSTEKSTSD
ncbi:hypothetical protein BB561_001998 [Smittium simulii]|uniref:Uncharacterized protein n=1 Tax=Smittium simulii TaxID=133385 RepID=A0A2T9YS37_9FUNG|nr:hypothetical protein BB561_001998 [Smittium simulii]